MIKRLALTTGEPAGVGPDICLSLAQESLDAEIVVVGSADLLAARASKLGYKIELYPFDPKAPRVPNGNHRLAIIDVPPKAHAIAGELDVTNSAYVINTLQKAYELCANKTLDALVTAPIHKGIIQSSGINFSGHTEYFANLAGVDNVLMTFYTPEVIVGMATTHCPLNKVSTYLTQERLESAVQILDQGLKNIFNIAKPQITILGLNPHAGEGGQIGSEEQAMMIPVINNLKHQGYLLTGPVPGDTAFTPENRNKTDAILAIYHDQGIAPIKALYFGDIVNMTLGLPFLRTSVDHGTALDLAGTGLAKASSLRKAIHVAITCSFANTIELA
ncbi:MAG: 4-hydroxythreonine-4-phosphate dehydrogenase PdxA [Candidatus Berkiella sp.]